MDLASSRRTSARLWDELMRLGLPVSPLDRRAALDELYDRLDRVGERIGGPWRLSECTGRQDWPTRGVYFFFEHGELREDGDTPRVVRVGTHALSETSRTTLWSRLRAHRGHVTGPNRGAGNHRGSIFRLHVGTALMARDGFESGVDTWGHRSNAPRDVRHQEIDIERAVSRHIGAMPFLVVDVADRHDRGRLERTAIGLLSNYGSEPIDPPSENWLGHHATREAIRRSGLWNVSHIKHSPDFETLRLIC